MQETLSFGGCDLRLLEAVDCFPEDAKSRGRSCSEERRSEKNRTRQVNRLNVLLQHLQRHFVYAVSYFEFCFFGAKLCHIQCNNLSFDYCAINLLSFGNRENVYK